MSTNSRPLLQRGFCRAVSLLLASPLALVLLIHPALFLDTQGHYSHPLLMLIMWGISNGFIHGVGFEPYARVWRVLFHPVVGWAFMALGLFLLFKSH